MTDDAPCPPAWDHDFPPPPGAYPVDDLTVLSPDAVDRLLRRAASDADSLASRYPHVVITRDCATGQVTRTGPFASGVEALRSAREFLEKYGRLEPRWAFTLRVEPLIGD